MTSSVQPKLHPPARPTSPISGSSNPGAPLTDSRPCHPLLKPSLSILRPASSPAWRPRPSHDALASISKAHQAAGFENSPASTKHFVVGEVLKGARRTLGVAQKCKDPLLLNDICRLLAACPKNLLGLRDRALILIGFAGAFRRSELCAMTVSDLCFSDSGLVINVPRSKADQEQAGEKVAIPFWRARGYLPDQSASQVARRGQRHRRRGLSRSRSSRPRILHRTASRLNRGDLQNRRSEGRHERNQHRRP